MITSNEGPEWPRTLEPGHEDRGRLDQSGLGDVEDQRASVGVKLFPPGPWIILLTSPFMPFTPAQHPLL